MKILFLADRFPPEHLGGEGEVVFNLAKEFQEKGHTVFVITTTRDKNQAGEIKHENLKIFRIYADYHERWRAYLSLYNPQTIGAVEKIIKRIRPDIVQVDNIHYYLSYYCLKIAKKYARGVFLTAHDVMLFHYGKLTECINPNDFSCSGNFNYKISAWQQIKKFKRRYNPFRNIIIRHYLKKYVDKVFAVSSALKKALNDNSINNVEIIHNSIDINSFQIKPEKIDEFRQKYNLKDKKIILFGGRLSEAKGGEKIIRAMSYIAQEVPETILLILGRDNEYVHEILALAGKLKIEKNIVFIGWLWGEELKASYHACDIAVVPSLCFETFVMINIEAMVCKKPVVSTCFGGPSEVVQDGVTGYIINPFDIKNMAEKIIDILKNPQKAEKMGEAGYQRVVESFNLDKKVERYFEFYNRAIQKK